MALLDLPKRVWGRRPRVKHLWSRRAWTKRRVLGIGGIGLVVVIGFLVAPTLGGSEARNVGPGAATSTAMVETRTLVQAETVEGTLDFGPTRTVAAGSSGTVTSMAEPGSVVGRGEELFSIDLRPTVLLFGDVPAYRDLRQGISAGPDIEQLESNLTELGYFTGTPDNQFGAATTSAVAAWQRDRGVEVTGEVRRGEVAFLPEAARVAGAAADLGAFVQSESPVLEYTGSAHVVRAELDASQADLGRVGEQVTVRLPDRTEVVGTVSMVADIGSPSDSAPGAGAQGFGAGEAESAVREVTITLDDLEAASRYTTASVDVEFIRSVREDVLAVPVEALLAVAGGGYTVETAGEGGTPTLVPVRTGMFADGYVEVSGEGLEEGLTVVVPAR